MLSGGVVAAERIAPPKRGQVVGLLKSTSALRLPAAALGIAPLRGLVGRTV